MITYKEVKKGWKKVVWVYLDGRRAGTIHRLVDGKWWYVSKSGVKGEPMDSLELVKRSLEAA